MKKIFKIVLLAVITVLSVLGFAACKDKECAHEWGEWSISASSTCLAQGTKQRKCSLCEEIQTDYIDIAEHDYDAENIVWIWSGYESATATLSCITDSTHTRQINANITDEVTAAPTCSATGLSDGKKCSVCKETLVAQTILPKVACDYESVITAPTCEAQGYTTHTCSTCGDNYIDSYKSAFGHSWGSWKANAVNTKTIRNCTNNCGEHQEIIDVTAKCIGDYYRLIGESVSSDDIVLYALINDEEGSIIEIDDFTLENMHLAIALP